MTKTLKGRTVLVTFAALFGIVCLLLLALSQDLIKMVRDSIGGFEDYPFGTEFGYHYCSKETYFAVSTTNFYIYAQALVVSVLLYRSGLRVPAISVLLGAVMLIAYLMTAYGSFH